MIILILIRSRWSRKFRNRP